MPVYALPAAACVRFTTPSGTEELSTVTVAPFTVAPVPSVTVTDRVVCGVVVVGRLAAVMLPTTFSVLVPVPGLLWLTAALLLLLDPQASAAAAAARVRMRFI